MAVCSWLATPAEKVWRPPRAVRCGISGERIEPSDPTAISLWLGRAHRWVKALALLQEAARLMQEVGQGSQIAPALGWQVRLIELPADRIVVVGDTIVYTESDDEPTYQSGRLVAMRVAQALGTVVTDVVDLSDPEAFVAFLTKHGIDRDEWNYAQVVSAVLQEV